SAARARGCRSASRRFPTPTSKSSETGLIKAPSTTRLLLPWLFLGLAASQARAEDEPAAFAQAGRLLQYRCAMPGCHAGPNASAGMRMEADQIYRSAVNIHARTDGRF